MECKRNKWNCEEGGGGEGKFGLPALTKTKLKGNGEVSQCEVNDIIAGEQKMEKIE